MKISSVFSRIAKYPSRLFFLLKFLPRMANKGIQVSLEILPVKLLVAISSDIS